MRRRLCSRLARALALAPAARGHLFADGSSPYALVGTSVERMTQGSASATRTGLFANVGYEWRLDSGLGILLGGGVGWRGSSRDVVSGRVPGLGLNAELGLRYMFR